MSKKSITIETSNSKEYFEIEEYSGKLYVYKLDYNNFWSSKNRTVIGETKSMDDAVTIAKAYVSGTIRKVNIN